MPRPPRRERSSNAPRRRRRGLRFESLEQRFLLAADSGDAPSPFPTATHEAVGPTLGWLRDVGAELGANAGATGDGADDDGVYYGTLRVGQAGATITVNLQNAPAGARLDAWWDFNRNNIWQASEQIADNLAVVNGDNAVTFDIPATAVDGPAYARFRLSTAGNLTEFGAALDGEVEDYYIPIARSEDATFSGQSVVNFASTFAVDAADLDGDGDLDLVTGGSSRLEWHENVNGAFKAPRQITSSSTFSFVKVADIDNDGLLDVFGLNSGSSPAWFKNNGNGTFAARTISIGSVAKADLGDADGDGDLDLLVGEPLGVVWYDNVNGTFGFPSMLDFAMRNVTAIALEDLDHDGDLDALVADAADDEIAWFENAGGAEPIKHVVTYLADNVRTATPADVDGDGDFDVIASVTNARDLVWYENGGEGTFEFHLIAPGGAQGPPLLQADDLDGDGDLDLLAATSTQLKWYENDGLETFTPHALFTGSTSDQTIAADVDGDGRLDIVSAHGPTAPQLTWQRQLAAMDFGDAPAIYHTALQENGARHNAVGPTLGVLRDAELDRLPHTAAGEAEDDGVTFGELRAGAYGATVTVNVQNAPEGARLDAWIDFDGDGSWGGANERIAFNRPVVAGDNVLAFDVPTWARTGVTWARFRLSTAGGAGLTGAALDGEVEDHAVTVLAPAASTGHFGPENIIVGTTHPANVTTADLDGDGDGDLIVASEHGGSRFFENRGAEGFIDRGGTFGDVSLVAEDYDGDGDLDLIGSGQGRVTWYENLGPWSYTARQLPIVIAHGAPAIQSIFAADMDGDGDADVMGVDYWSREIWLLENLGQGKTRQYSLGYFPDIPEVILASDVDGDGDLDIVVGGKSYPNQYTAVRWYQNGGRLNFISSANVGVMAAPFTQVAVNDIAAADLDRDGDMDLVSTDLYLNGVQEVGRVTWYQNDGEQGFLAHHLPAAAGGHSIDLADVDGDGDVDILAAGSGISVILENNGAAQFAPRTLTVVTPPPPPPTTWTRIVAGDFDGDHDLDAFVAAPGKYAWYANGPLLSPDYGDAPASFGTLRAANGAEHNAGGPRLGTLRDSEADGEPTTGANAADDDDGVTFGSLRAGNASATVTINVQNTPAGARVDAWIDFNGDGTWQISEDHVIVNAAVIDGDNSFTFVVPGTAKAGTTYARVRISTAGGHSPIGFAADGEVEDYAVVIAPPGETNGEYAGFRAAFSGNINTVLRMGDVDGDGDIDAVVDPAVSSQLHWYENVGDGAFLFHLLPTSIAGITDLQIVDLDRDGDMDFVALSTSRIAWYENNGEQSFRRRDIATSLAGTTGASLDVADRDQDGDWDLLIGAASSGISWYVNNGQQSFTRHRIEPVIAVQKPRAVDLDGDGDLDIVAAYPNLFWLENRGGYVAHTLDTGISRDVVPTDLDRDGDIDLVVRTDSVVRWYENTGAATFVTRTLLSSGVPTPAYGQGQLAVADPDGDGDMDVLLTGHGQPRLLANDGAQNFALQVVGPTPGTPDAPGINSAVITVADIDGDGWVEIFVGGQAGGGGWFEALPRGDYNRDGRVDDADRALWESTLGQMVGTPGAGADGDQDGQVDEGDLAVWEDHAGEAVLPLEIAANALRFNSIPSDNEAIDGSDFLAWQRNVGYTTPLFPDFNLDWKVNGAIDAGDLAVWKKQYGSGLIPDLAWITLPPGSAAAAETNTAPALAAAEEPALAANVILTPDAEPSPSLRPAFAPRPRTALAARDALLARLVDVLPIRVDAPRRGGPRAEDAYVEGRTDLTDAVFAGLAEDATEM